MQTARREEGGISHFNPQSITIALRQEGVVFQGHRLEPLRTPSASATLKTCGKCSWRCGSGGRLAPFRWLEQVMVPVLVLVLVL